MKLIVCFPLLDLRFFLTPEDAPGRPGWTVENFETIGSLGKVLCTIREDPAGATADASPALLFRPEYGKAIRKGQRRALARPKLGCGAEVLSRQLFADTYGHVRLELLVDSSQGSFANGADMLEQVLDETVEVPQNHFEVLALAGKRFAKLYLDQSAKTAPPRSDTLPEALLREGLGSPFAIVVQKETAADAGTLFPGGSRLFPDVRHGSVAVVGADVGLWTLHATSEDPPGWKDHVRSLCRILCALREVRLLAALDAAESARPFHLDREEVTRALRRNDRFIRTKSFGGWPVPQVLAFEERLAHGVGPATAPVAPAVRRDALRSVERSLTDVRAESGALPEVPRHTGVSMTLDHEDRERLVRLLSNEALTAGNPKDYFFARVRAAEFSNPFLNEAFNLIDGTADDMARKLVQWSENKGTNPQSPRDTVLGSLLRPVLPGLGLESAATVATTVVRYRLYRDPKDLENLRTRFQIPDLLARPAQAASTDHGPDFEWRTPVPDGDLQGFLPEPPLLDVGFLIRAVNASRSVCLVSVEDTKRAGTGFLVAPGKVLTNHHVVFPDGRPADDTGRARAVSLQFGVYSDEGQAVQTFRLADDRPFLAASSDSALDYVLLQGEDDLGFAKSLQPAALDPALPAAGAAFHTLQHPAGGTMKLAVSENAVKFIDPDRGIAQYATRTGQGSSGAPCFTSDWKVAALHHAERARWNGAIREGILMRNILSEIEAYID